MQKSQEFHEFWQKVEANDAFDSSQELPYGWEPQPNLAPSRLAVFCSQLPFAGLAPALGRATAALLRAAAWPPAAALALAWLAARLGLALLRCFVVQVLPSAFFVGLVKEAC